MPRTKVSKSSKRNREADLREDKIREFESKLESFLNELESSGNGLILEIENKLQAVLRRTKTGLLQIKMVDFMEMDLGKFADWTPNTTNNSLNSDTTTSITTTTSTLMRSAKSSNPNDEGYLTEDSCHSHKSGMTLVSAYTSVTREQHQHGRTPGPLSSARARRPRRSRSACGDYVVPPGSALRPKLANSHSAMSSSEMERTSRSKMRTPMASRSKALSADRIYQQMARASSGGAGYPQSPPTAFMRWPKPGEMVLSMCGSPVVAQVLPDKFANVNIPVRDGVLSMRPKKLDELQADFIDSIDPETLNQIKTLHANLNLIVKMADEAIRK